MIASIARMTAFRPFSDYLASVVPVAMGISCTYAWAGLVYGFHRFRRTEDERRFQTFLGGYCKASGPRTFSDALEREKRETFSDRAQAWGVCAIGMIGLRFNPSPWGLLISNAAFLFAGTRLGVRWYALRCMNRLAIHRFFLGH